MNISTDLFQGELVKLVAEDVPKMAEAFYRWGRDTEYLRLLEMEPCIPRSIKTIQAWLEKELRKDPPSFYLFMIRTLQDDRLIGDIDLGGVDWVNGDAFVGIGLGEREYWGNGYGTDAMRVVLRYAFTELNLHRVSLDVFEYNPRACRSYEKAGFTLEGRAREYLHREGRRWDLIFMGILREEWLSSNPCYVNNT